ncbi:MAG TPA: FmdB family zinc ribbon protein [Verrucomicrobiae bacterium]
MPTYEYACEKCGHQFEKFQSMKDDALTVCPKDLCCKKTWGKGKVKRQMGAGAGLIFKGTGFYITDYRSEGYKQAAKSDTGSSSSSSSKPAESKSSSSDKPAKSKAKKA